MDNDRSKFFFRVFVCAAVTAVLGMQLYGKLMPEASLEGDFSEIMESVKNLMHGLHDVNSKHEVLKYEIERINSALPTIKSSAGRAKEVMRAHFHALETPENYDRQVADYALETAGGRIVDTGDTVDHVIYDTSISYVLHCLAAWFCKECINARAMINPGTMPGQCWAFKGQKGEAIIRLLGTVLVTGVSLEHISPKISPTREISMAPRFIQLEGLERKSDMYAHDFGTFEYIKDGAPIQYFEVKPSAKGYYLVRVKILSNWGHPVYTCVYRVRVHGRLAYGQLTYSVPDSADETHVENE